MLTTYILFKSNYMINHFKRTFLICAVSLLFIPSLFAIDYYLAKDGNDVSNNGLSLATPFLTIQKASNVAVVGDNKR